MENGNVARGQQKKTALPFCRRARSASPSDFERSEPHPEQWLLIEWPNGENEPTKYWFSSEAANTPLRELVKLAKHRWIIERDYEELKQELDWPLRRARLARIHHHATLCIAAYGFLVAERSRFSPSARAGRLELRTAKLPSQFEPRGRRVRAERHHPNSIATVRIKIARALLKQLPCCPFCCGRRL